MPPVNISLDFMPAFFSRHLGISYGEAYYFDPGYRAEVERAQGRFLYRILGRYGVGNPDPQPYPNLFIQPIDLLLRTQGAGWRFPPDATVESIGAPWAGKTPAEIAAIDPRDAAHHPVIDAILDQYHELRRRYGDAADVFGTKSGTLNIHAPCTSAHQLYGEDLFLLMLDDPTGARMIFDKVWSIYQAIFARVTSITGARLTRLYLGDCSVTMLSPAIYRDVVLPVNQALIATFPVAGYHSCGPSTHLLPAFAHLPALDSIELGPGTNLRAAASHLPGVILRPLVDPLVLRYGNPDDVRAFIALLLRDTVAAPAVTLCAWSFDRDTPVENVAAMYDEVMSG